MSEKENPSEKKQNSEEKKNVEKSQLESRKLSKPVDDGDNELETSMVQESEHVGAQRNNAKKTEENDLNNDHTDSSEAFVAEASKSEKKNTEEVEKEGDATEKVQEDIDALSEKEEIPENKNTSQLEENETLAKSDDAEDEEENEEEEEESEVEKNEIPLKNYHGMDMESLVKEFSTLLKKENIQDIREHAEEIKNEFNARFDEELEQKREEFVEEGGNIIDFYYSTPLKKEFNSLYFDYKEKRNAYYKQLKQNLNKNLENRLAIIEELKGMIGLGANMNANFNQFKELQERWKKAGPIPRDKYNTVWNNYHHHVEHFYDFLHLDREFRDLDFKHNLDQKLKIILRAEELAEETNINRAFRELQMLHKMWKEDLGPVAKEYRDEIWDKFSEVTKKIHENRQAYFAELDKKNEKNLEIKREIIEKISKIAEDELGSHKETQEKMKQIEALRNEFFQAGKVPQKDNEKVWSEFKSAVRNFNRKKNSYYKNLKKEQFQNLEKKLELVKIAEENKDNPDFETVTPLMKKIQSEWKAIGHVPRKDSNKIWRRFKEACNHYFDQMHRNRNEENKEELEAFDKKKELLESLKTLDLSGDNKEGLALVKEKIEEWNNLGRVPKDKRYIEGKFNKALDQIFENSSLSKKEAEMLKFENRIKVLDEADDSRKIEKEEFFLRKKVDETQAEIRQLENNLQFFSNVNTDNPLVQEVHQNIARHKEQLETWKAKLKKVKAL
ncbi:MAG TPA: DUF349 domain-containing protein [Flavobacteriaceae bacterium]|nr:DUF349 domain-containing protein [Flavobacteriaceae bacterium]